MPDPLNATRNRILSRLPEAVRRKLESSLQPVDMPFGQVLYQVGGPVEYAYFPAGAVLSALTVMLDGSSIEVGTIGFEGVVGYYGFGSKTSPHKMIVQIAGQGHRIASRVLQELVEEEKPLRELLTAYHIAFMCQVSQSVACNGLHGVQQRCCRWLLMSRDRVGSDDIRLTHEYLAIMLGTRRASVSEALAPLYEAGLVRSHRGVITILDRAGLEVRSCECYAVVRDRYEEILGPTR